MEFSHTLLQWYASNKRDLPWRQSKDPYVIWLAEIIFQQTRIDQGLPYFNKFTNRYPKIDDLAQANEDEVLKLWQGLGYYSRARNLHSTAKNIFNNLNGEFPNNHKELLKLKGIGKYTAAAISSFCFNEKVPVVDGNVYRVLTRIFGIFDPIDSSKGVNKIFETATELLSSKHPADYNQAIMDFGAIQCTPKKPDCSSCCFNHMCYAFENDEIQNLPVKSKKIKQKTRYFNYLVLKNKSDKIHLNKRINNDIWKGLYDFPLIESDKKLGIDEIITINTFHEFIDNNSFSIQSQRDGFKHILSHQIIHATFWTINIEAKSSSNKKIIMVPIQEVKSFAVPRLIEQFIESEDFFN